MWIITIGAITLGCCAALYLIVIIYLIATFKEPKDPYGSE